MDQTMSRSHWNSSLQLSWMMCLSSVGSNYCQVRNFKFQFECLFFRLFAVAVHGLLFCGRVIGYNCVRPEIVIQ